MGMRIETVSSFVKMLREKPWSPVPWSSRRSWSRADRSNALVLSESGFEIEYDPFQSLGTTIRLPVCASREEYCDLAVMMADAVDRYVVVAKGGGGDLGAPISRIEKIAEGWRESISPCCLADAAYYCDSGQADAYAELVVNMRSMRDAAEWLGKTLALPDDEIYVDEELGEVRVIHSEKALIDAIMHPLSAYCAAEDSDEA